MTEKEHLAAASVWAVALVAVAASWAVVVHTDRVVQARASQAEARVTAPPVAGLVAATSPRRRVVVVRRSRAS